MTYKIMIIGSSHVAALRNAAKTVMLHHGDIDLCFFAAPGPLYRKFSLDPVTKQIGALDLSKFEKYERELLEKLNGSISVSFANFDAVILVGHDIKETLNARALSRFSIDDTAHDGPERRMSRTAYQALLTELATSSLPDHDWWRWDTPKLFVVPAPRIAENCVEVGSRTVASWVPLVEKRLTVPASFELYIDMVTQVYAAHGLHFIPTPQEAYGPLGLTKQQYSEGAVYIQPGEHRDDFDAKHMNEDFGALSLENILQTVKAQLPDHV